MFSKDCTADERAVIEKARRFATTEVAPVIEDRETRREPPRDLLQACAAEFAGLLAPREFGGRQASVRVLASVLAALARADFAFAFSLVVHLNLTTAIARLGAAHHRERYLGRMMEGSIIGAFCLTEPDAGTDAAAIATRARRLDNGGWALDGKKAWITNGAIADLFCVYAQTGEAGDSRGIASFLVERGDAGLDVSPAWPLMGGNVMGATGLSLDACALDPERAFAPAGEGFRAAMQGIDLARVVVSAMCCAILEDSLEIARRYARERKAFGAPTMEFQGVRFALADVASDLRAAQLLTEDAIALLDAGENARVAAAHAKKTATTAAFDGISRSMQAMGARGFRRDCALPRHLACAKMAQFLDGTTEVQNIVIGRALAQD